MGIASQLQSDLIKALKERKPNVRDILRFVLSSLKNVALQSRREVSALTDDEVLDVIRREIKKRKEASDAYTQGGRTELATKEVQEMDLLKKYLPTPLSREEISEIVEEYVMDHGGVREVTQGEVMKHIMEQYKYRVDGKEAREVVRAIVEKG